MNRLCVHVCIYDGTCRLGSSKNDSFRLVVFVVVGCIACLVVTCASVAVLCYVVMKAKRQSPSEGLFLRVLSRCSVVLNFRSCVNNLQLENLDLSVHHYHLAIKGRLCNRFYRLRYRSRSDGPSRLPLPDGPSGRFQRYTVGPSVPSDCKDNEDVSQ